MSAKIAALVVAFGILTAAAASAAAQGTEAQRQACMSDAFRLCPDAIPDEGRIAACLGANRGSLSADCRAQFRGAAPGKRKTALSKRKKAKAAKGVKRRR